MRCTLTIVLTAIALACSEAREGIPFHTKSPTSAEPIARELPFTPSRDRFARMLVEKQFHVVTILDAVDPAVLRLWFKRYPRKDIATGNQPFAETDISDGAPFRLLLLGRLPTLGSFCSRLADCCVITLLSSSSAHPQGFVSHKLRMGTCRATHLRAAWTP